jgi:hypothetical protein
MENSRAMTAGSAAHPGGAVPDPRRRKRLACLLLFSCIFLYNFTRHYLGTSDTVPNMYLPVSIILHGDFYLDRFPTLPRINQRPLPYFLQFRNGRVISSYPVLPAIMAVPVYLGPVLWLKAEGISYGSPIFSEMCIFSAKLAASLIAACSAVFVFLTLAAYASQSKAFALAHLYAFGTSAFAIASQALWMHGPAMLFLSIAAYLWLCRPKRLIAAGAMLSLAVAARPVMMVAAGIFTMYVAMRRPRELPRFLAVPAVVAALLLAFNLHFYNSLSGGYREVNADMLQHQRLPSVWTSAIPTGLAGLLISPSRGLFIFSPFLLAGFWGGIRVLRDSRWREWQPLALSVFGQVLLFSCYSSWWGGMCYGPRLLSEACPYLVLLIAPVIPEIDAKRLRRVTFQVLAAASIFVQTAGAMLWTGNWYADPTDVDIDHARLWDWKDNEITRTLRNYRWSPESPHKPPSTESLPR